MDQSERRFEIMRQNLPTIRKAMADVKAKATATDGYVAFLIDCADPHGRAVARDFEGGSAALERQAQLAGGGAPGSRVVALEIVEYAAAKQAAKEHPEWFQKPPKSGHILVIVVHSGFTISEISLEGD